jgi:hypothetical protein
MTSRNLARIDGRNVRGRWASFQIDYINLLEYHRSIRIAVNSESNYVIVSCAAVLVGPLSIQSVSHWEGFKEERRIPHNGQKREIPWPSD